jgi:hypothetical protein
MHVACWLLCAVGRDVAVLLSCCLCLSMYYVYRICICVACYYYYLFGTRGGGPRCAVSGLVRVQGAIAHRSQRAPLAACGPPRNAQCTTLALAGRGARAHSTVHSRSTQLSRAQGGRYARSKRAGHGHGTPGTGRHRHPARSGSCALPRPHRGHWNFRRRSSPSRSSSR